mmetsp:Transcript_13041/g.35522  ORF Transcript_13041/g.35522 Transcript_13041/m.35522 type:complete len:460 (-) Transcript_13041:6-1385(-)
MPDEPPNNPKGALVHLGGLDDLLLHRARAAPDAHEARVLHPICTRHEASVVWAERCGEHARAPGPMHFGKLQRVAHVGRLDTPENKLVDLLDVPDGDDGLLLAGVGDLGDGRDGPVVRLAWSLHAPVVAVADGVDAAIALLIGSPELALPGLDRESHVHQNPAAATRTLLAEHLLRHEVIRGLHADADVLLVGLALDAEVAVEAWVLSIVLHVVKLLDPLLLHVPGAIRCGLRRQRPQALREGVDDGQLQFREEVLQFRDPFHTDEAGTHDQDLGALLIQLLDGGILLEDMPAASLQEALIQVGPRAFWARGFMDSGEPEGLAPFVEDAKVAARRDDAEVKVDDLLLLAEHRLDRGSAFRSVQICDLAPDELAAHPALNDRVKREGQRVEVLGLDISAQHARSVLEELLGIDNGHQKVILQIPGYAESCEAAANDKHTALGRWHDCDASASLRPEVTSG